MRAYSPFWTCAAASLYLFTMVLGVNGNKSPLTTRNMNISPKDLTPLWPWCVAPRGFRDPSVSWRTPAIPSVSDDFLPSVTVDIGAEVHVTLNWTTWANGGVIEDSQHQGYMIAFKKSLSNGRTARCSCFHVPSGVHTMRIGSKTYTSGTRGRRGVAFRLQSFLTDCIGPNRQYDAASTRQIEIQSFGAVKRSVIVNVTIPSCYSLNCVPNLCHFNCKPLPVENLSAQQLNSTAVLVRWTHHPRDKVPVTPVTGFFVNCKMVHSKNILSAMTVDADTRDAIISNLEPAHRYRIMVKAVIQPEPNSYRYRSPREHKRYSYQKDVVVETEDLPSLQFNDLNITSAD